jgi:hypothetical protein
MAVRLIADGLITAAWLASGRYEATIRSKCDEELLLSRDSWW